MAEREDEPGQIGNKLLKTYDQLFRFWKMEYKELINPDVANIIMSPMARAGIEPATQGFSVLCSTD